jgi:CRISPR system Cascade subunit CasA
MSRYNLIEEKWIPVCDLAGNRKELGIRDVLLTAENLSVIEDPSPLVTAALHRFLLAVLYRALEGPCDIDEAKKLFKEGLPKDKIRAYLDKWKDRFYLFDEKYPFGQVPDFEPKAWRSWTALAVEHNADNAKVLFDHIDVNNSGEISFAAAIRWMLATHTFSVSTGKSELSHTGTAPSAGVVMAIPIGKTLADTLMYCLVPQNREIMQKDIPLWERSPETLEYLVKPVRVRDKKTGKDKDRAVERTANGVVDVYTWRSRSIKFKTQNSDGISELAFASGVGYEDSGIIDPLLAYAIVEVKEPDTKQKVKKKMAVRFEERGLWRNFDSLLPDETQLAPKVIENMAMLSKGVSGRFSRGVLVLGQRYYPPRPNIAFWRKEFFVLPEAIIGDHYIRGDIRMYLDKAEEINKSLYSACASFGESLLSRGDRKPEQADIKNFIQQIPALPYYWSTLEGKFHEVLRDYTLECNPDDIHLHHDWLVAVRNALQEAWNLHEQSISASDVWAVRALVKAGGIIKNKTIELNKSIKQLKTSYKESR